MKKTALLTIMMVLYLLSNGQSPSDTVNVYFFPGQGSDKRIFQNIELDSNYIKNCFDYPTPSKGITLQEFAFLYIDSIDQSKPFILVGQSMGGMICTELADTLNPLKTIIVSSAKYHDELPWNYRFQKKVPLNRLVPGSIMKLGALILQPIYEPDRRLYKKECRNMLQSRDRQYYSRTVNMIINWERDTFPDNIIHIHGDIDNTLPIRNVNCNIVIEGGSHMMVLTRGPEISALINDVLSGNLAIE